MTSSKSNQSVPACVSIAIFAWNEELAIGSTLQSLFEQSLFDELRKQALPCEVICVANGCTDNTAGAAARAFGHATLNHPAKDVMDLKVANLVARGKVNAWNQFVHQLSSRAARYLFMMDADVLIHRKQTLWNMFQVLETEPEVTVAMDLPRKDIDFKKKRSMAERLSLGASTMTLAADGQLCGQLYCIRAEAARRIYLPKDLSACEDGFIKTLVCTDFLSRASSPTRIRVAPNAEHTFEAYTSPRAILKNQKRQIMGQSIIHVLVDQHLKNLPIEARGDLAGYVKTMDVSDPGWLKRLIAGHVRQTRFPWRLHPGLLQQRFRHLRNLGFFGRLRCLPAALAGAVATGTASFLAYRSLKQGCTDYWPKAQRAGLQGKAGIETVSQGLNTDVSLSGIGGAK